MTKPGEGFGLSLSGGVNGFQGNPLDETDEGIFISQVTAYFCCYGDCTSQSLSLSLSLSLTHTHTHTL